MEAALEPLDSLAARRQPRSRARLEPNRRRALRRQLRADIQRRNDAAAELRNLSECMRSPADIPDLELLAPLDHDV
jgi:hypothetical protein